MKCPFLSGTYVLSCKAFGVYVPSPFELKEFCSCGRHKVCSSYIMVTSGDMKPSHVPL